MIKFLLGKYLGLVYFASLFLLGLLIRLLFLNHSLLHNEAVDLVYYIPSIPPLKLLTAPYKAVIHPLALFNVSVMKYFFSES